MIDEQTPSQAAGTATTTIAGHGVFHPSRLPFRIVALCFMCILSFGVFTSLNAEHVSGSYFCYDNPAALQDRFMPDLNLTNTQYGLLYSIYSWPNVVLPFLGGYLVDRVLGLRRAAIIFSGFIMVGQIIVAAGAWVNSFPLMVFGRLIFS